MNSSTVVMSPDLPSQPPWNVMLCMLFSLILHAGLLAGLQMIQKSKPLQETVPLVQVTLIPTQVPAEPSTTNDRTEEDLAPLPPMRHTPRSATSKPTSIPPPVVSQSQPIMVTSAVEHTPMPTIQDRPRQHRRQRLLKDSVAADTLFAQQATKMTKRPTMTETGSSSVSHLPEPSVANIPQTRGWSPAVQSIHAAPATTRPTRTRRLVSTPPTSNGTGLAKIGVRHSVRPVYPRLAKEEGWEGTVLLKVLVRTSGKPDNITIEKSSGYKVLDDAAMDAMHQWRFTPARDGNFPVEKYLQVPLKFGLQR